MIWCTDHHHQRGTGCSPCGSICCSNLSARLGSVALCDASVTDCSPPSPTCTSSFLGGQAGSRAPSHVRGGKRETAVDPRGRAGGAEPGSPPGGLRLRAAPHRAGAGNCVGGSCGRQGAPVDFSEKLAEGAANLSSLLLFVWPLERGCGHLGGVGSPAWIREEGMPLWM